MSEAGLTLGGAESMKTKAISQELTSGGEETPVIRRCDKFSNVDVERMVGAAREGLRRGSDFFFLNLSTPR